MSLLLTGGLLGVASDLITEGFETVVITVTVPTGGGGWPTLPKEEPFKRTIVLVRNIHGSWLGAIPPEKVYVRGSPLHDADTEAELRGILEHHLEALLSLGGVLVQPVEKERQLKASLLRELQQITEDASLTEEGVTVSIKGATDHSLTVDLTIKGVLVAETVHLSLIKGQKDLKRILDELLGAAH